MENNDKNRLNDLENTDIENKETTPENPEQKNNEAVTVDAFLSSLEAITPNDIAPSAEKKKRIRFSSVIRTLLLIIFISVFIVAAYMIGSTIIDGHWADKIYSDLSNDFFEGTDRTGFMDCLAPAVLDSSTPRFGNTRNSDNDNDYVILETNNQFFKQFKEKLEEYKQINPDIYGWLQVDGTNISYACVKGMDNNYYLDHTATLEQNTNGAIFADFRCEDKVLENENLVFYGHNMIYPAQMFHDITKFLDESFFRTNRYATIYTLDGVYRYEIFAVYETHSTYRYCQLSFMSELSFIKWCNEMNGNALYRIDMNDFLPTSRILTLSTCTNGHYTGRYALQARLVSVEREPTLEPAPQA